MESILRLLSEFNSFERVKRRELKYSVNGVSRRISLTNKRVWIGGNKCRLSVKILAICQLSVKFKAFCQLSVK